MKRSLLAVLLAAGPALSRAQMVAADAPPAGFGLSQTDDAWVYRAPNAASRTLSADERARLTDFFAALPADGRDAALAAPVLAELSREGRDPAVSGWISGAGASSRLTDQGRGEVAAAVLASADAPRAVPPALPSSASSQLSVVMAAIPARPAAVNFDGARAGADAAAVPAAPFSSSRATTLAASAELPDAPTPAVVPVPTSAAARKTKEKRTKLDDAFWASWWGYHAGWAADFATTGLVLARGGYEKDHLYTMFGNKNMAGVIGSAAAVHVAISAASLVLYKEARKRKGWKHAVLETAAIAANSYWTGVHMDAAAGNAALLNDWPGADAGPAPMPRPTPRPLR